MEKPTTCSGGGRKRRGSRKMRGGNFVGVGEAIGPGILERTSVANTAANNVTGAPVPELFGGRRRRTGKKGTRKGGRKSRASRRHTRRRWTMRGGASSVAVAQVGHGFMGSGVAGLANHGGYSVNNPGGGPTLGGDGVYRSS